MKTLAPFFRDPLPLPSIFQDLLAVLGRVGLFGRIQETKLRVEPFGCIFGFAMKMLGKSKKHIPKEDIHHGTIRKKHHLKNKSEYYYGLKNR